MIFKKEHKAFVKSTDPCQPALADTDQNFSMSLNFLHVKGPFHIMIQMVLRQNAFYRARLIFMGYELWTFLQTKSVTKKQMNSQSKVVLLSNASKFRKSGEQD